MKVTTSIISPLLIISAASASPHYLNYGYGNGMYNSMYYGNGMNYGYGNGMYNGYGNGMYNSYGYGNGMYGQYNLFGSYIGNHGLQGYHGYWSGDETNPEQNTQTENPSP